MRYTRCPGCMKEKAQPICEHCGWEDGANNASHQLPVGAVLNNQYVIGRALGQGGFGITYLGWDRHLEIPVAIKEYYPNGAVMRESSVSTIVNSYGGEIGIRFQRNRERFLREAKALAKFSEEPEIVHIYSFFQENNTAYIVMEYVDGITLKQHVQNKGGKLSAEETLSLLKPVMEALEKVHRAGIVHRDISPDNIMLLPDGSIKLLDFGAVRTVEHAEQDAPLTKSTEAILKQGYAPIEQYQNRGSLGPWTDVYALCATVCYCISGHVPPDAPERMLTELPLDFIRKLPGLTEHQKNVLEKGMELRPENRIASMKELADQLLDEKEDIAPRTQEHIRKTTKTSKTAKKRKWPIILAVIVTLLTVCVLLLGKSNQVSSKSCDNILMSAVEQNDGDFSAEVKTVPRSDILRKDITAIYFQDSLKHAPADAWDVSQKSDGSVLAWTKKEADGRLALYFAGDGGVRAPVDCWKLFADYENVKTIDFADVFYTDDVQDMSSMFANCQSLVTLDLTNFDTANVQSMGNMFVTCRSLESVDVNSFDTSKVKQMYNMFACGAEFKRLDGGQLAVIPGESKLTSLDLRSFDTSNVTNMSQMFGYCTSLTELRVDNFDTVNVELINMFHDCTSLKILDISSFDLSSATNTQYFFYNTNLETLYVSQKLAKYHPSELGLNADCEIIVMATDDGGEESTKEIAAEKESILAPIQWGDETSQWSVNKVPGSSIPREHIVSIEILDTLKDVPADAWDVSQDKNQSVMAWTVPLSGVSHRLYIAGEGGVWAPTNSEGLFSNYKNAVSIDFGEGFHTEKATNMANFFTNCQLVGTLDLSCFDTSEVTSMSHMFAGCSSLQELDISTFNTGKVSLMTGMFQLKAPLILHADRTMSWESTTIEGTSPLKELDLRHFDTSNVSNYSEMFMYTDLVKLDISSFDFKRASLNGGAYSTYLGGGFGYYLEELYIPDQMYGVNMDDWYISENCRVITKSEKEAIRQPGNGTGTGSETEYLSKGTLMAQPAAIYASTYRNYDNTPEILDSLGKMSAFGSQLSRDVIISVTFLDSLADIPENGWDASETGDGSVMAWTISEGAYHHLYLASEGGVYAPENCRGLFAGFRRLEKINWNGAFLTDNATNMEGMFFCCMKLTELDLAHFNTTRVTDMSQMFKFCYQLESLNVSGFDTSSVTDMSEMFAFGIGFYSTFEEDGTSTSHESNNYLATLDLHNFDTSSVTDMTGMFLLCKGLIDLDISSFDTSSVTKMNRMFEYCESLPKLDLRHFDTSQVVDMADMFFYCNNLKSLNLSTWNTENVKNMSNMFNYCRKLTSLDVSSFDTSYVTDMSGMFSCCNSLGSVDVSSFDTSNVTDMGEMFCFCESLSYLDLSHFNTAKVTSMRYMFHVSKIGHLNISGFDTSHVTDMMHMFYGCRTVPDVSHFDVSKVTNHQGFMPSDKMINGEPWIMFFMQ